MKQIELKTGKEIIVVPPSPISKGGEVEFDYSTRDFINTVLNKPGQSGFSIDDIEKRLNIRKKLRDVPEGETLLQLEDSEYEVLKQASLEFRWGTLAECIVDFVKQFK